MIRKLLLPLLFLLSFPASALNVFDASTGKLTIDEMLVVGVERPFWARKTEFQMTPNDGEYRFGTWDLLRLGPVICNGFSPVDPLCNVFIPNEELL